MSEHTDDAPHLENHTECVNRCYHNFSLDLLIMFLFLFQNTKQVYSKNITDQNWVQFCESKTDQNSAKLHILSRQPSITEEAQGFAKFSAQLPDLSLHLSLTISWSLTFVIYYLKIAMNISL